MVSHLKVKQGCIHICFVATGKDVTVPQHLPVSINETSIDVVRALYSSNGLKTHSCGLVWHYVDKAVLELVAGEIGTDES